MGSIRLRINVSRIEDVLQSFNVIRVKKSVVGEAGPYELISAASPTSALIESPNISPYDVVGKNLTLQVDSGPEVEVEFTGMAPLSVESVATQINVAVGHLVALDAAGYLRLESTTTGTASRLTIVGGTSLADFGFTAGQQSVGLEAHLTLYVTKTLYEFVDNDGDASHYYVAQFYNTTNGLASNDSVPFQGEVGTLVDADKLSTGSIHLVDARGVAVAGQSITFYPLHEFLQVGGYQVALTREPITVTTDNAGYAEVNLVRGLRVRIVFDGTSVIRDVTVPDQASFELMDILGSAQDPFSIRTPQFNYSIRRTL